MRLTCPCCGATLSIEAMLADGQAREAVAAALALPAPLGDRVLRYLGLFRPAKRALSWDRAARLLTELAEPIKAAQIERNGLVWPAPLDYWEQALEQMLANREKLRLPLTSHGYLYEIVAGLAAKGDARAEQHREEQAKRRPLTATTVKTGPKSVGEMVRTGPPAGWKEAAFGKK